jgi:alpha-beta hydrolase superfamily lysophospholipase
VEPTPTVRSYDAVVPAYGAAFDKASWAPVASWLAGRGLDVLAIGFRGYGRSRGTDAHALFKDVLAARRRRLPCSD